MHIPDEDVDAFREYVKKQLRDNSDADPEVLAEYVIALLQADDAPESEKRAECEQGLAEFLRGDVVHKIVDDIFDALRGKAYEPVYKPSAQQQSTDESIKAAPTSQPPTNSVGNYGGATDTNISGKKNKRAHDVMEGSMQQNGYVRKAAKQPRQGRALVSARSARKDLTNDAPQHGEITPAFLSMPVYNANDPTSMMTAMQSMMQAMAQFSAMMGVQQQQQASTKWPHVTSAARCHDYDNKGFCARGDECPYQHGIDKVVYVSNTMAHDKSLPRAKDARNAATGKSNRKSAAPRDRTRGRPAKYNKGSESAFGEDLEAANTKIVVEHIPDANYHEEAITAYFGQFGHVEAVELLHPRMAAIVTFDTHESAVVAKQSRGAIFGDRFVRTYWYKISTAEMDSVNEGQDDSAELTRRIQEAQRAHEIKLQQLEELRNQRQELEHKMRQHAQERRKLMQALRAKERKRKKRQRTGGNDDGTASKSGSDVDVYDDEEEDAEDIELRDKLAALEAEAELLGLNTEAPYSSADDRDMSYVSRGRGSYRARNRGRNYHRGRYATRGATVAGGRGGVLRLDNRTRSVEINVAPESANDERMRQFILRQYETEAIEPHPNKSEAQIVTFQQRYMAEDFASKARHVLQGDLKMSWYDLSRNSIISASSAVSKDSIIPANGAWSDDDGDTAGRAANGDTTTGRLVNVDEQGHGERDLDIADDDDAVDDADDDRFMI